MNTPLVSICCTTYNHEKYIRQTLESFLLQKTSFPIEIIVHDDASTDNTKKIIEEYAKDDARFVTIFQTENKYSQKIKPWPNFVFPKVKGKYIALCEGDDYWIDPLKLQKQIDFLEQNKDYSLCFHNVKQLDEETGILSNWPSHIAEETTIEDLADSCYIVTNSAVLRNNFVLPDWFNVLPIGDWPLFLIQVKNGKIKKMEEHMSVYRIHAGGVWSSVNSKVKRLQIVIDTVKIMLQNNITDNSKAITVLKKKYRRYRLRLLSKQVKNKIGL